MYKKRLTVGYVPITCPMFDDEPNLPFLSARSKDVFHLQQAAPFGRHLQSLFPASSRYITYTPAIPHHLTEDYFYSSHFLSNKSIIHGNSWYADVVVAISSDNADNGSASVRPCRLTSFSPNLFTFKPERFTGPNINLRIPMAVNYVFSFGRGVCPGHWMDQSL
ncbi:hypothetical protein EI94DRAFT_959404 [Lactarius quietus]|nr:hypothetical protein EI94DRAFT_959404 [Lactarius quietus]